MHLPLISSSLLLLATLDSRARAAPGLTLDAGVGVARSLDQFAPSFGLGGGAFVTPTTAVTLRASGFVLAARDRGAGLVRADQVRRTSTFLGPSVQRWLGDHGWLGAGVGVATWFSGGEHVHGWAGQVRAGYGVGPWQLAVDVTHAYYATGGPTYFDGMTVQSRSTTATSVGLLAGYQWR